MSLTLYGYRFSVYTRIVRMALHVVDAPYAAVEVDPFADPPDLVLGQVNRFHRVPVLDHDGFILCETAVIARYLAALFPAANLIPAGPQARARMEQVAAVVDAYGYLPMVRCVFSHAVFRPLVGADADKDLIQTGLEASRRVLAQLDEIAQEGLVLTGPAPTLADLHLAPMIGYFAAAPQGNEVLAQYAALSHWWAQIKAHPAFLATDPGLATLTSRA